MIRCVKPLLTTAMGAVVSLLLISSCSKPSEIDNSSISSDSTMIAAGKSLFFYNCVACHNFENDGIGPYLGGLTKEASEDWIKAFIKNPKGIIESGDQRAVKLFDQFKSYMPAFNHLSDDEVNALISYIHTYQDVTTKVVKKDTAKLANPIPDSIALSEIVVNLNPVFQIPPSSEGVPKTRITKLEPHPNTHEMYMLDLNGKLYRIEDNIPFIYMDLATEIPELITEPGLATGFGSFAFHPEFEENGLLYVGHTEAAGTAPADFSYADSIPVTLQWIVSEWTADNPKATFFKGTSRELFRMDMVVQYHGVQNLAFNPTVKSGDPDYGNLYLGVGDGGAVERGYDFLAVENQMPWGSIFRIDPDGNNSKNQQYGIPQDNPYVNDDQAIREIYAKGFRNPHKFSWSSSGKLIAANIGHHNIESLYVIEPGRNYGWPYREGSFEIRPSGNMSNVYPLPVNDSITNVSYPAAQYDHDEGNAICGGYVYEGDKVAALKGKYIFGDIVNGRLFFVEEKDLQLGYMTPIQEFSIALNGKITSLTELSGNDRAQLRLGQDAQGEIYLFSKNDGVVYQFEN